MQLPQVRQLLSQSHCLGPVQGRAVQNQGGEVWEGGRVGDDGRQEELGQVAELVLAEVERSERWERLQGDNLEMNNGRW